VIKAKGRASALLTVNAETDDEALHKAELVPVMRSKFGPSLHGDVCWEDYEIYTKEELDDGRQA